MSDTNSNSLATPDEINAFWFSAPVQALWFNATPAFDAALRSRFLATWHAARAGGLEHWEAAPTGALALTIVLDQFPLNMYRNEALAFSTEQAARDVAERAIERRFDQTLDDAGRAFLYLPLMHSEKLADQDRSVALFEAAGLTANLRFARHHREIVRRFGRFPHRNAILGRISTPEELAYLDSPEAFHG
ncbi:MAG: DUF924 family protein [Thiotrichales bacterium]